MSKSFLITYQGGTCGNLIAALIYCLTHNVDLDPGINGSMHNIKIDHPWVHLPDGDLEKNYNPLCNLLITHDRNIEEFAKKYNLTVIKIIYQAESAELIRSLVNNKAHLPNLKNWYTMLLNNTSFEPFTDVNLDNIQKDQRVLNLLNQIINDRINNFMPLVTYYHHTINFEDIWNNHDRLLTELSQYTGLEINKSAKKLLHKYVKINSKLYDVNIKL
jgi:hypothetical protein